MDPRPLPSSKDFSSLLGDLIGKKVGVAKAAVPLALKKKAVVVVALFAPQGGTPAALCAFDLPLASYAGAALSLFPPKMTKEYITAGRWDQSILDNIREVFNVAGALFNSAPNLPIVRLQTVHVAPPDLPEEVVTAAKSATARLDLDVEIPGYGEGKMTALILA